LHERVGQVPSIVLASTICLVAAYGMHRFVERPLAPRLRRVVRSGLSGGSVSSTLPQKTDSARTTANLGSPVAGDQVPLHALRERSVPESIENSLPVPALRRV
jgi:hypothetical protein